MTKCNCARARQFVYCEWIGESKLKLLTFDRNQMPGLETTHFNCVLCVCIGESNNINRWTVFFKRHSSYSQCCSLFLSLSLCLSEITQDLFIEHFVVLRTNVGWLMLCNDRVLNMEHLWNGKFKHQPEHCIVSIAMRTRLLNGKVIRIVLIDERHRRIRK